MRRLACVWHRILDAPHLPIAIYLAFIGFATLRAGPRSTGELEHALPTWLTYAWSGALATGGVAVTIGVLANRSRMESAGHCLHVFGIALAALVFAIRGALDATAVVGVATFALVSAIRLWQLAREREAQREARAILNGER